MAVLRGKKISVVTGVKTEQDRDVHGHRDEVLVEIGRELDERSVLRDDEQGQMSGDESGPIENAEGWQQAWQFTGLQRPTRVMPYRNLAGGVVDFGRTIHLSEVRAFVAGGPWKPASLPEAMWVTTGDERGVVPSSDSAHWKPLVGKRFWEPGAKTGNYGESAPVDQFRESIAVDDVPVRYLKTDRRSGLAFYDRDTLGGGVHRYALDAADVDGDGVSEVLVSPQVWPKYVRRGQLEDDIFAVLKPDGSPRYTRTARTSYQAIRALDYLGLGHPQVVTASIDGEIEVLNAEGEAVRTIDLYAAHQRYHEKHGRSNTRSPAGGYVMPFDVGLWRSQSNQPPGLIVSRYGWYSFIDHQGELDGLLTAGGYVMPRLLPEGLDLAGDGTVEQLCLSYGRLWRVNGPRNERVPEPNGYYFYPQVYQTRGLTEPAWETMPVDGPQVLAMQPVALHQRSRLCVGGAVELLGFV